MNIRMIVFAALVVVLLSSVPAQAASSFDEMLGSAEQKLRSADFAGALEVLRESVCDGQEAVDADGAGDSIQLAIGLGLARSAHKEHDLAHAQQVARIIAGCGAGPVAEAEAMALPEEVQVTPVSCTAGCDATHYISTRSCMRQETTVESFYWCMFMADHNRSVCYNRCWTVNPPPAN